jgi:hypothetical protein
MASTKIMGAVLWCFSLWCFLNFVGAHAGVQEGVPAAVGDLGDSTGDMDMEDLFGEELMEETVADHGGTGNPDAAGGETDICSIFLCDAS